MWYTGQRKWLTESGLWFLVVPDRLRMAPFCLLAHFFRTQVTKLIFFLNWKPYFPLEQRPSMRSDARSSSARAQGISPRALLKRPVLRRRTASGLALRRQRRNSVLRFCCATRGALSDAPVCVTSAPSREAALGRWQAPGGSRSSTTEDGDERRRRGGGSGSSARSPGNRAGHDPGLGGGGAAPTVRVLLRL